MMVCQHVLLNSIWLHDFKEDVPWRIGMKILLLELVWTHEEAAIVYEWHLSEKGQFFDFTLQVNYLGHNGIQTDDFIIGMRLYNILKNLKRCQYFHDFNDMVYGVQRAAIMLDQL